MLSYNPTATLRKSRMVPGDQAQASLQLHNVDFLLIFVDKLLH